MKSFRSLAIAALAFALVAAPAPSQAKGSCFSDNEVNAEQTVRLHSELMVIALTCRYSSEGASLTSAYQTFTRKHLAAIRDAEGTLINYYRGAGSRAPESKVDKVRTLMGNEYSQRVADLSHASFCENFRDRVMEASTWSASRLKQELKDLASRYPCQESKCKFKTAAAEAIEPVGKNHR
ncbi:MAG: hypothetical protein GC131_00940 [Alphaproteobacteria bacterium]|nr:hypothetical protein [Alphaproteobacteria bacterium]